MPVVPRQVTQEGAEAPAKAETPPQENSLMVSLNSAYPVIVQYFKPDGFEVRIIGAEKLNAAKIHAGMVKVLRTLGVEKQNFAMRQTASQTKE